MHLYNDLRFWFYMPILLLTNVLKSCTYFENAGQEMLVLVWKEEHRRSEILPTYLLTYVCE